MKQTIYATIFIFSMVFAVGSIDGGYHGVPVNDNWLGFFIFTAIGILFAVLTIKSQSETQEE
jgi:hypothetical protein